MRRISWRGLFRRSADDRGQDLAEYALLIFFLALVCVIAMSTLGLSIGGLWGGVLNQLAAAL
jgi:Flp pilus assembly pilin Flp